VTVNNLVVLLSVNADVRNPIDRRFFLLKFTFNIYILIFNTLQCKDPLKSQPIDEQSLKFGSGTTTTCQMRQSQIPLVWGVAHARYRELAEMRRV